MPPYWKHVGASTTPALALAFNRNRVQIVLFNLGDAVAYWDHHPTLLAAQAGPLPVNQPVTLSYEDGDMTHEPIWVITAANTADIRVYESTDLTVEMKELRKAR